MKVQGRLLIVTLALAAVVVAGGAGNAFSANYPTKPIKLIVPYPPGGGNDVLGRIVAAKLTERLGQPVLVENRAGAAGTIGANLVAKSDPDGYTILIVSTSWGPTPSMYTKLPYDEINDFRGIIYLAKGYLVLVVNPSLGVKSVKELIALAKSKPGKLTFSSPGLGTVQHLGGEMLKSATGVNMLHVPYKGAVPSVMDVIAGRVSWCLMETWASIPHIKGGKLIALAQARPDRSPELPNVPTMKEAGISGIEFNQWYGLLAPAATPKQIVAQLNTEIVKVLSLPDVKEQFSKVGVEMVGSTPEEFDSYIKREVSTWAKVIKGAGITPVDLD